MKIVSFMLRVGGYSTALCAAVMHGELTMMVAYGVLVLEVLLHLFEQR